MTGDPAECRTHAVRCAQLAVEAKSGQLKNHFIGLSKAWESLAQELEHLQILMAADAKQGASNEPPG
jgi:hypothetical protein